MFIKYYTSDDSDVSLLVETGNSEMAKKLKRKVSHALFDEDGDLHPFSQNVLNMWCISKFFTVAFDDDVEALEETEKWIRAQYDGKIVEDFSMGVEGPTGLNQGIPHGGPGKGVIPAPLFGKGKIVTRDDDKKKLKKALDVLDLYGVKVKKTKKVSESFNRRYTLEDFENYLYHDLGFDDGEINDIVNDNRDLIFNMLYDGKSPAEIAAEIDFES